MSRSRVRERERLRAPVQTTDPEALRGYAAELRPVVASLRTLAEDATARPSQRVHSRALLRRGLLRGIRELEARIDVADPPEYGDPAGCGACRASLIRQRAGRREGPDAGKPCVPWRGEPAPPVAA